MLTDVVALVFSIVMWNEANYITLGLTDDQVYRVPVRDGFWGKNPIYLLLALFSPGDEEIEREKGIGR